MRFSLVLCLSIVYNELESVEIRDSMTRQEA